MPNTNLPALQLPDPNGFTNALAAGMKMRELQNASDRLARKDELADTTRNELSAYLSGDRSEEAKRRLAAASPESVLAIEKTAATAGLSAAKTATATAQGEKARLQGELQKVELGSRILGTATDEPSYQAALAQAKDLNLDISDAPERYFPDWVKRRQQQGQTATQQISSQLQALNVDSQIEDRTERRAETEGYHDATLAGQEEARAGTESRFQRSQAGMEGRAERKEAGVAVRADTALRKEFNALPAVKNYTSIVPIMQSAREAAKTDTAAADMNLVYAVAKVNDPESVVRESETAMVVASGSPAQRFMGQFNYVAGGGRLTGDQRKELMAELESRAAGHERLYKDAVTQYRSGAPEIGSLPELGAGRNRSATPPSAEPRQASPDTAARRQAAIEAIRRNKGMVP